MCKFYNTTYGEGKHQVWGNISYCKNGASITIFGGQKPHIGCIVLAVPRPSLKDKTKLSTTTSVLNVLGHKDDIIAKEIAKMVALMLNAIVSVAVGIHVQDADEEDINILINNAKELTLKLVNWINKNSYI